MVDPIQEHMKTRAEILHGHLASADIAAPEPGCAPCPAQRRRPTTRASRAPRIGCSAGTASPSSRVSTDFPRGSKRGASFKATRARPISERCSTMGKGWPGFLNAWFRRLRRGARAPRRRARAWQARAACSPYRRQFFVVEAQFIERLGLQPGRRRLERDRPRLAAPARSVAWQRLCLRAPRRRPQPHVILSRG